MADHARKTVNDFEIDSLENWDLIRQLCDQLSGNALEMWCSCYCSKQQHMQWVWKSANGIVENRFSRCFVQCEFPGIVDEAQRTLRRYSACISQCPNGNNRNRHWKCIHDFSNKFKTLLNINCSTIPSEYRWRVCPVNCKWKQFS